MAAILNHIDPDSKCFRPSLRRVIREIKALKKTDVVIAHAFLIDHVGVLPSKRHRLYLRQLAEEGYIELFKEGGGRAWLLRKTDKITVLEV